MLPGKDGQSPYVTCAAKVRTCLSVCLSVVTAGYSTLIGLLISVCVCVQGEDSDKIGPLAYFPPNGTFNLMYYPYYGKKSQVRHVRLYTRNSTHKRLS